MPHPIDALISDCDGVLVDSEVIAERVMYEALSAYAPLEELQRLLEGTFGLTSRDILDRVEK
ncbi:HAD family hydrolase, partial [Pseudomonas aeruginosa]|nr:HAD family hydrolase [Pseudomonas aeruginosa]